MDDDGAIVEEQATLCLTCLDAELTPLYTDCGGSLPPPPADAP